MKSVKYSILFFILISFIILTGCNEKSIESDGHTAGVQAAGVDQEENDGLHHGEGEAEGEHEELPDDIVEMNADQIAFAGIRLAEIEMRQVSGVLKANGLVIAPPQNLASVSVPLGGFIKSSDLLPGSAVKKGQTLAIIENTEFVDLQQAYFEIKSRLEYAEAEFKRHTELYKEDVYSEKNLQQVTSDYQSLKAQLKGMEQKLLVLGINPADLTVEGISAAIPLVSPISGYIKTANISLGKYVSPTEVLFEIVNNDKLLLELSMFEQDANSISTGQVVHFSINNEAHQHSAVIYQVGKSINTDKTYKVYATINLPCPNVLPGMYVLAHIEKTDNLVASVPAEAVVSFDDKYYIFAFERNKEEAGKPFTEYRFIEVEKGDANDGFIEIKLPEGFDIENTKIVIKGAYNLLSAKKNAGEMTC